MMGLTWKEQGEGQGTCRELSKLSKLTDSLALSLPLYVLPSLRTETFSLYKERLETYQLLAYVNWCTGM